MVCNHEMIEAPHEYGLTFTEWHVLGSQGEHVWEEKKKRLYDEVISKSPIFDRSLHNRIDEIMEERSRKYDEMIRGITKDNPYGVKCPYCGSTNVKRISAFAKFGIFALGKNSKQWHCQKCDSDF